MVGIGWLTTVISVGSYVLGGGGMVVGVIRLCTIRVGSKVGGVDVW